MAKRKSSKAAMQGMLSNCARAYDFDGCAEDVIRHVDAILEALAGAEDKLK